jgi:hypothetical protein
VIYRKIQHKKLQLWQLEAKKLVHTILETKFGRKKLILKAGYVNN